MFYGDGGRMSGQKSAVPVLAWHAETLLVGADDHCRSGLTHVAGVPDGGLILPGFLLVYLWRSIVFEQCAQQWHLLLSRLSLRQHTELHGIVVVGRRLFVGGGGALLWGLYVVVVVARVGEVGLVERLCVAHLADPVAAVGRVQQGSSLVQETAAQVALCE
jgi:hypothetical protein